MRSRERFPVAESLRQVSKLLNISPERILRRAGLPEDHIASETRGVTTAEWYALWDAVEAECGSDDLAINLGQTLARGPFVPAMFAFSCSPNIETGLKRLALFKPLVAPVRLELERREDAVIITYHSIDDDVPMTDWCARFEAVYFLESCRIYTGEDIVPLAVGARDQAEKWRALEPALKVRAEASSVHHLTLSLRDATLPLITQNDEMWANFEQGLRKKLLNRVTDIDLSDRVRNVLLEALPSGKCAVDDVCARLHVSRRTLQRKLKAEGSSFQAILDDTRSELSQHYLKKSKLSVVEISYLLGFRDPGSFFRAFHGWTGRTPIDVRNEALN